MGVVYLAEGTELSRKVAVKALPADMVESGKKEAARRRGTISFERDGHVSICYVQG